MQLSHHIKQFLPRYWAWLLFAMLASLIVVTLISLSFGATPTSFKELVLWLMGESDLQSHIIIQQLRLPRALLALCIGSLLATCGAISQGLFRNPLADPSLIGVSAGASAGASIAIVFLAGAQWSLFSLSLVSMGAFVGGILSVYLVYQIATNTSGTSVSTMLLAGIAIAFIAGGVSNALEFFADNDMLRRMSLWRMGGLDSANTPRVIIAATVAAGIFCLMPRYYSPLNALLLGESEARHLGIDVNRTKRHLVILVAAGVGTSVALAGTIAFIGLVVPHMVRLVIGPNHRFLLPISAFMGALLLLIADAFARTVIAPTEIPVGLVSALLGAPIFISLLRKRHHYGLQE
ncbi:FecCD family ABC transporter permease [Aurantivibrio plasticivorans]